MFQAFGLLECPFVPKMGQWNRPLVSYLPAAATSGHRPPPPPPEKPPPPPVADEYDDEIDELIALLKLVEKLL